MDTKKYLLASLTGLIVMFVLAWLGHTIIMESLFEASPMESITREMPIIPGIAVAYLVMALLMAYMYPKGIEGSGVFGNGLRFGVLVGLLVSVPISLIMYSTLHGGTLTMVVAEGVWHMVEQGAGGVAIAYVYGKQSATSDV